MSLQFEWDESKNVQNQRKHGIAFEDAITVFSDEHGILIDDPEHSSQEERFVLLGLSASLRTMVVCHCYRGARDIIRVISARRATKPERARYNRRWKS